MLAANDHEQSFDVRERTTFDIEHAAPLDIRRRVICVLAGDGTGLTADAAVQIDDHPVTGVGATCIRAQSTRLSPLILRILTRARSALDPVESVNASESDVTELRLGRLRSLA